MATRHRKNHSRTRPQAERALTLIEVIFAIVLFAGAMITLLGLQSSNLARTREDRNKVRAMLAAREILSAIEIQDEPLETGTKEDTVDKIVESLLPGSQKSKDENEAADEMTASLEVTDFGLPDIGESALQKITVTIYWGNGPFDLFRTTFFAPGKLPNAVEQTEE